MNILAWLIFIPLQLIWIPIQIVASMWVAYKQLLVSKRLGVSQTAIEIFNGRWMMAHFAMRDDPAVLKLGKALPNTSVNGLFITLLPFWVKWKLSGQHLFPRLPEPSKAGLADLVPARTVCFDSVLDRRLPQVQQFVMLGAGYDTRAYRSVHGARVFEVDQPVVQAHKLSCIKAAGIAHDHVTFVSIDFSREKVLDKLTEAGFDASLPTVFLWEGVTLYLSEEAVRAALGELRDGCAPGSVVVADFYGDRVMKRANRPPPPSCWSSLARRLPLAFPLHQNGRKSCAACESAKVQLGRASSWEAATSMDHLWWWLSCCLRVSHEPKR